MKDAYTTLGLDHESSAEQVDAAYARLVRRYPPELNPRRFAKIKQAYEFLSCYEEQMRQAAGDLEQALDMLFPKIPAILEAPPEPPEPLCVEDWQPVMNLLRERVIRAILVDGLSRDLGCSSSESTRVQGGGECVTGG